MTGDEREKMERTMQFILEQQAQFMANVQRLQESRAHDERNAREDALREHDRERLSRLERAFVQLTELAVSANERMNEMDARSTEQRALDTERLSRLERAFVQLTELAVSANERMNEQDARNNERMNDIDARNTERRALDDERMGQLERAFVQLSQSAVSANERMNEHDERLAQVEKAVVMLTRLVGGEKDGR